MATATFNLKQHLAGIASDKAAIDRLDAQAFEDKLPHYVSIGGHFDAILTYEVSVTPDMTPTTCFKKHEKVLPFTRSMMTDTCLPMYRIGDKKLATTVTRFRKVGLGPDKRGLRIDWLAQAVRAVLRDKGEWKADGTLVSVSNSTQTKAQIRDAKAKKIAAAAESFVESEWVSSPATFDLRYFVPEEVALLEDAIKAWHAYRAAGGKVLSSTDA
jgi:hypothetical protein